MNEFDLKFAAHDEMVKHWDTVRKFVVETLGEDVDTFFSDESTLWHFIGAEGAEPYYAATLATFGVEIADISSGSLIEIAKRLGSSGNTV